MYIVYFIIAGAGSDCLDCICVILDLIGGFDGVCKDPWDILYILLTYEKIKNIVEKEKRKGFITFWVLCFLFWSDMEQT